MTHAELCLHTAQRFMKASGGPKIALYEYQSFASAEFPDVLVFYYGHSVLFEIKTSYADFRNDCKKECRKKYYPQRWLGYRAGVDNKIDIPDLFLIQKPHLGNFRYFVCEPNIIPVDEVPEGWGLYYVQGKKFILIKDSDKWRPDIHVERDLLINSFRRYANGDTTGILINTF